MIDAIRIVPNSMARALKALQVQVRDNQNVIAINEVKVERGVEVNQDPDKCPWIGIYPLGENFPTRALGISNGFRNQQLRFAIVMQESSVSGGERAQDDLGTLVEAVTGAILSNPTIGGTAQSIGEDFQIYYTDQTKQGDRSFLAAVLTFTAEKYVDFVNPP